MIAIFALTGTGAALARRVRDVLGEGDVHAAREGIADRLRASFRSGETIIAVMAAGIIVRALAPVLGDKTDDPPVLALAEDASVVVPLLGGHHGANALARRLAEELGAVAAITTAGDVALGLSLDEPPRSWRIADRAAIKPVAAALLAGEPVRLDVEAGDAGWLTRARAKFNRDGRTRIVVTQRVPTDPASLTYHPPVLALGVGTVRGAMAGTLEALVREALARHGLAAAAIACVTSIDLKSDEPAVHALAATLGVPARFFAREELAREDGRLATPSPAVERAVGVAGVAEAAALAAAGTDGRLIVPKVKGNGVTCALALAARDIDASSVGRARGRLAIIGIGPGDSASRTLAAVAALREAEEFVGYGLYLDLIADLIGDKPRHDRALGEEEARVRLAIERAALGKRVALVSSGDAGIYGLATLAFEVIEAGPESWRRLDVQVIAGLSALQVAAARVGAPLGHDFCAISLSDLLTPWPMIEQRLEAAAAGDFVVALYNPASLRRREGLDRALAILGRARDPDTPVVIARNLGRPGESVRVADLARVPREEIDMLTILIVGARATRGFDLAREPRVFTPRGYAAKAAR